MRSVREEDVETWIAEQKKGCVFFGFDPEEVLVALATRTYDFEEWLDDIASFRAANTTTNKDTSLAAA